MMVWGVRDIYTTRRPSIAHLIKVGRVVNFLYGIRLKDSRYFLIFIMVAIIRHPNNIMAPMRQLLRILPLREARSGKPSPASSGATVGRPNAPDILDTNKYQLRRR